MARLGNSPEKCNTRFQVEKATSPGSASHPLVHEATIGNRRRWAAWQDCFSVALGVYLASAPLWIPGAPVGLFVTLGVLVFAAAVWAGSTASSTLAEFVKVEIGRAHV